MQSTIHINNKHNFTNTFLNSISRVSENAVIDIREKTISCLCSTGDGTLIQYINYNHQNVVPAKLNVPDIKRLSKLINCISQEEIQLQIDNNSLSYQSTDIRFKYHLLDDGILSPPGVNIEKIKNLSFDTSFNLSFAKLSELIKGSTLAAEVEKLYIYTQDGIVYGELTDKQKPNMDSFCITLADKTSNEQPIKTIPFNFENIRTISSNRCDSLNISINNELGIAKIEIVDDQTNIVYILSALMN